MESRPDEFPHANAPTIARKLQKLLSANASEIKMMFESADRKKTGLIPFEVFK